MGSLKSIVLAGGLALGVSAAARAADLPLLPPAPEPPHLKGTISSGLYLRGDIGVGIQNVGKYHQDEVEQFGGTFAGKSHEVSFSAGFGIGYRVNSWLRFDVTTEYQASRFKVKDIVFNPWINDYQSNHYKANRTSFVTLFNSYVDLGTWNCLTPYIGGGIGFANNNVSDLTDYGDVAGSLTRGYSPTTGSKTNLAWALMAGVDYAWSKNLTLEFGYRYLNLGDAQSSYIQNAYLPEAYAPLKAKNIDSHDFRFGMRWNFGEPDCCGTPEPVAYAPVPTVRKY